MQAAEDPGRVTRGVVTYRIGVTHALLHNVRDPMPAAVITTSAGCLVTHLPGPAYDRFRGCELYEADGAACVEFLGADADLRS